MSGRREGGGRLCGYMGSRLQVVHDVCTEPAQGLSSRGFGGEVVPGT